MEGASKAGRTFSYALNQALAISEDPWIRARTAALGTYAWPGNSWAGTSQYGEYTAFAVMDCGSCGLGAQSTGDGLDISSYEVQMGNSIPDIESNEALYPMLYLWRQLNVGAGGPGLHRGGNGIDLAWIPWKTDGLVGTLENACAEVPSQGMLGGLPGDTNRFHVHRGTGTAALRDGGTEHLPGPDQLGGERETLLNHVSGVPLGPGDVFQQITGGGAGWKDPLLRPATLVEEDVNNGYVPEGQARAAYGVEVGDAEATRRRRSELRVERIGGDPSMPAPEEGDERMPLLRAEGGCICGYCGESLGEEWRQTAVVHERPLGERMAELGLYTQPRIEPRLLLREWFCPACASAVHTQVEAEKAGVAEGAPLAAPPAAA
jgi:N-methylhydantoinase B